MDVLEISKMPTVVKIEGVGIHTAASGYHESLLRAWNILRKVKELLDIDTPSSVILEMIAVMESVKHPDTNELVIEVETAEQRITRVLRSVPKTETIVGSVNE